MSQNLQSLTAITTPADTDIFYLVNDPTGTPTDRKITLANLKATIFSSPTIVTPTIAKLANLTSNGLVTTSGGDGTLSVTGTIGSGNVVLATSPTIVTPTIAKLANLTSNGIVTTSGGDGTLSITATTGSGNVVLASSPTIVTPTIASFANATHDHSNAAGGGTLSAAVIASGTLALARGGTNADLSATGGSNQFLKQTSGGGAVTVAAILSADLTTPLTTPPAIGGTTPAAGAFTTLSATGNLTLSGAPGKIIPSANSTTALQIGQADGTAFVTYDTTNKRVGNGVTPVSQFNIGGTQSNTTWTTTGIQFAVSAASLTNTTSTGTVALQVENSFGVPTLLASSATTITTSANVYIAGAPVASTNVTQGTPVALLVSAGAAASMGLIVQGVSGQSNAIVQVWDNNGNPFFSVQSAGQLIATSINASTNVTADAIVARHQSSGTPAASFGTTIRIDANSASVANRQISRWRAYWSTATDASRASIAIISASDSAAERDVIGLGANGSAGLLGFYPTIAAAPIAQPTTAIAAATFVANTSLIANDTATFDGYTIGQVVKALRNLGLLA